MCDHEEFTLFTLEKAIKRPNGRKLRRMEKQLQRQVYAELQKQKEFIIKRSKKLLNKKSIQTKSLSNDIDDIFDALDSDPLIAVIIAQSAKTMKFGADYRIKKNKLGRIGINFNLANPLAVQYLETDRPLVLSKMEDTTKDQIKPILIEAAEEGLSPQDTALQISEASAFSKQRSLMIAVNEIGNSYEHGNMIPMQDASDEGHDVLKNWSTVNDDRVTKECKQYQNQRKNKNLGIDEYFSSTTGTEDIRAPRQSNPRCRCTILWDINFKD